MDRQSLPWDDGTYSVWLAVLLTFVLLHCDPIDFPSMPELIQDTRSVLPLPFFHSLI
jgi:hypothetical protein